MSPFISIGPARIFWNWITGNGSSGWERSTRSTAESVTANLAGIGALVKWTFG